MNDTEAIIATAKEAVEPYEVTHGLYLTHDDETGTRVIDVRKELHEDPVRTWKSGTVTVDDADSFIGYMAKHAEPRSELWASPTEGTITAVIDAPGGGKDEGDRGGHRATLQLTFTDDWKDWAGVSGKMLTQVELAEFIESHLATFVTPAGAVMLELAQSFQATSRVNFQSSRRLANGEAELEYTEVIDAKAGRKGSIPIPVTLELALRPFEGEPRPLYTSDAAHAEDSVGPGGRRSP